MYLELAQSARQSGGGESQRATSILSPLLGQVLCSWWGFFFLDWETPVLFFYAPFSLTPS